MFFEYASFGVSPGDFNSLLYARNHFDWSKYAIKQNISRITYVPDHSLIGTYCFQDALNIGSLSLCMTSSSLTILG